MKTTDMIVDWVAVEIPTARRVVPAKGGEQASGRLKGWFKTEEL
jgi:hypothetical protein